MTTQILVTVEFDPEATRHNLSASCQPPTRRLILDDLNTELRQWAASNPYELRDPNSLSLRLELAGEAKSSLVNVRGKLAGDLHRIADDLACLSKLCREAV